jgi:2-polyprenyl-6-methoxyphenol hydroxylase-like FAD-dependent oxidoreductase
MRTVLISGAGVAGSTLAYWLARRGFRPTVVERWRGQRSSGAPVDVRGPALPVAERMGVVDRLRAAATRADAMRLVDDDGRSVARIRMSDTRSAAGTREIEVPRADLAAVLYEAAADTAEFRFDDTITSLEQDGHGVDVTFERAAPARFDLVVGADGLHSTVRRLAFGPEAEFVRHVGLHVATLPLGEPVDHPREVLMHATPGRLVAVHPSSSDAVVAFIFRGPAVPGFDHRDIAQHRRVVATAYRGGGWRVPELLDLVRRSEELYFDGVSTVRLPGWSRGRITLLGDAAAGASLLGDGSSLAMAGAYTLAEALAEGDDHRAALHRYEATHRVRTDRKRRQVGLAAALLVPKTRLGLAVRNGTARTVLGRR